MSKSVERASMDDLDLGDMHLPPAPVTAPVFIRTQIEPEQGREAYEVYDPVAPNREPLVSWSCKMPLRLRTMLEELATAKGVAMTQIVVDLLEIHLPRVPRKKRG